MDIDISQALRNVAANYQFQTLDAAGRPQTADVFNSATRLNDVSTPFIVRVEIGLDVPTIAAEPTFQAAKVQFLPWHVETLLDQSADLLERALAVRSQWDAYGIEGFKTLLGFIEFQQTEIIAAEEINPPIYDSSTATGNNQYMAIGRLRTSPAGAMIREQDVDAAGVSIGASKDWDGSPFKYGRFELPLTQAKHAAEANKVSRDKFGGARDISPNPSYDMWMAGASADEAQARYRSATAQLYWNYGNHGPTGWLARRRDVSTAINKWGYTNYSLPGGILNYPEKMKHLQNLFNRDLIDALSRLNAIHDGLTLLYGYDVPLPPAMTKLVQLQNPTTIDPLTKLPTPSLTWVDEYLNWVRDAIGWMVRFAHSDQNFVISVSLNQLLGNAAFKAALIPASVGINQKATWNFTIPDIRFNGYRHVRLRGISVFSAEPGPADSSDSCWQVTVRAPRQSYNKHLDDSVLSLDQTKAPPCRLGRVGTRMSRREPDVVGIATLHNLSPYNNSPGSSDGEWEVSVDRFANNTQGTEVSVNSLLDLQIDLYVAARWKF